MGLEFDGLIVIGYGGSQDEFCLYERMYQYRTGSGEFYSKYIVVVLNNFKIIF
jgi:hypothetical protein